MTAQEILDKIESLRKRRIFIRAATLGYYATGHLPRYMRTETNNETGQEYESDYYFLVKRIGEQRWFYMSIGDPYGSLLELLAAIEEANQHLPFCWGEEP